ncbi:LytR/AlgR family response regulator transcription factor [Pseudoduganella sp. UC29_106]|uniref:LytR/AlgR family response regulator transcription factor n=1 Tax=Pseudoduganella sp. UC29_106 TaxID=3374553 RepID=UPI0037580387
MRILIVDDERPARDKLRRMLAQEPDVTDIEEARDGIEAIERAATFAPDAIFLDVQMPEVSGLEVAASLPDPAPLIVFATAYDEYALRDRFAARPAPGRSPSLPPPAQLMVTERGVTHVVRVADILWLETADNYVVLHTSTGAPLLRQTLAGLLDALGPAFQRCHRRAAVQLQWIERIEAGAKGDGEVLLRGGARVPLSRQFRQDLLAALG